METAQKIAGLEAQKQQLIQQSIITENALQSIRQQVAGIEGQLIELKLVLLEERHKKNAKPKKAKAS